MDNLECIAKSLKNMVGRFEADAFARQMTSFINGITLPWNGSIINGLVSPFRQLFYLFNLNITSDINSSERIPFDLEKDWPIIVPMLAKMESAHRYEYGELKPFSEILFETMDTEEVLRRRQIGLSTYISFFHVGPLHFEEQAIEKVVELYKNFDSELIKTFGWNADDVIALYNCLDALFELKKDKAFIKQQKKELNKDEFKKEILSALANGSSFKEAMRSLSEQPIDMFKYIADPSMVNIFSLFDLEHCSKPLVDTVLEKLTITSSVDKNFLFFSQPNQLYKKPIYKLLDGNYMIIDHRVLLNAMSDLLQEKCSEIIKNKNRITKARDKYLERKIEQIFKDFYKQNSLVKILPSYYLEKGGSERDLLVLAGETALIIEAKAGKIREPMYDPDKAYNGIWQDFKETIDYGYIQAYSVKEKLMAKMPFDVYDKKMNVVLNIDPNNIKDIHTIIVTYNKFGHVQSDLQMMLDLYDNDDHFPWAVCIDDLEIFLHCCPIKIRNCSLKYLKYS